MSFRFPNDASLKVPEMEGRLSLCKIVNFIDYHIIHGGREILLSVAAMIHLYLTEDHSKSEM